MDQTLPRSPGNYIYGHVDPRTGQLRYVGKTERYLNTRTYTHLYDAIQREGKYHHARWLRQLHRAGLKPQVVLLHECSDSDVLADAERFWIRYFRSIGCPLTNLTEGGEGSSGYRHTTEAKQKVSEQNTKLSAVQVAEAESFYKNGSTLAEIGEMFGVHRQTVSNHLRRAGTPLRSPARFKLGNRYGR